MARSTISFLVAVAWCVFAGAAEAQAPATDAGLGTWRLNVERSVWTPGPRSPADRDELRVYAALEDGWYGFHLSGRNAAGNPTLQFAVYKLDGQQYPVHGLGTLSNLMISGEETNLTRSYRVIDENTVEYTTYTDGVPGTPAVREVAPNGMTFIQVTEGTTADGVEFRNVLLFDRVN